MEEEKHRALEWKKLSSFEEVSLSGENHILVISIDDYQYCGKLNNAVGDAESFITTLLTHYHKVLVFPL